MKVYIERSKEEKTLKFTGKVVDLLEKLGVNKEEVIIVKNNELVTLEESVKNDDLIRILSVISGG